MNYNFYAVKFDEKHFYSIQYSVQYQKNQKFIGEVLDVINKIIWADLER